MATPTQEDHEELILSCRYGDREDVESFISQFGVDHLATARDDNGNTILHMAAANGHTDLVKYILPQTPKSSLPTLLRAQNNSGSTALHWAALNSHLETCQFIVGFEAGEGTGVELLEIRNVIGDAEDEKGMEKDGKSEEREGGNGRSVLGVAEEAGWEEGARWMVSVMRLGEGTGEGAGGKSKEGDGGDEAGDEDEKFEGGEVEVEIEDADGGIARMSLGPNGVKPVEVVTPPATEEAKS